MNYYPENLQRAGVPEHMCGAVSRYVIEGAEPGGFLTAVLENNLRESLGRADSHNATHIPKLVDALYYSIPAKSWGSAERVSAWQAMGGVIGHRVSKLGPFKPGQKVTTSGFPGRIVRMYSPGMVEVRLASGVCCVPVEDVKRLKSAEDDESDPAPRHIGVSGGCA